MTNPYDPTSAGGDAAPAWVPGERGNPPFGPPPPYQPMPYYPPLAGPSEGLARRRRRRNLIIAAGAVVAVVAAGLSAYLVTRRTGGADPTATLHDATGHTLAVSRYTLDQHISLSDGISNQDILLRGSVDTRNGLVQARVSSGSASVTTVVVGDQVWLSSTEPNFNSLLPPGKTWLQTTVAQMQSMGIWHPLSDSLDVLYLVNGAGPVTDHGVAAVAGVPVRHYTFPINLHKAYCTTDAAHRSAVQRAFHANGIPVNGEAWVDGHDQIVKLVIAAQRAGGLHLRESVQLSNLSQPVRVTRPAQASTVTTADAPGLIGALSGLLSHTTAQPPVVC